MREHSKLINCTSNQGMQRGTSWNEQKGRHPYCARFVSAKLESCIRIRWTDGRDCQRNSERRRTNESPSVPKRRTNGRTEVPNSRGKRKKIEMGRQISWRCSTALSLDLSDADSYAFFAGFSGRIQLQLSSSFTSPRAPPHWHGGFE